MTIAFDRLFAIPLSWTLAILIVMFDRVLPEPDETPA